MHKSATKCNETIGKWCKNKHGASKIIDTLETYHSVELSSPNYTNFCSRVPEVPVAVLQAVDVAGARPESGAARVCRSSASTIVTLHIRSNFSCYICYVELHCMEDSFATTFSVLVCTYSYVNLAS
jgi:hypothetical protein